MKITIWLPKTFYYDHRERDLPNGDVIEETSTRVLVKCTEDEIDEILDDAKYYAGKYGPDDISLGLKKSAERTVLAIKKHLDQDRTS
jgi:hypothetical protein